MAGVYAVNSYLLVICSAGCLRVFPFFCHFFADFRLFSVLLRVRVFLRCFCVFFVFMQKKFCIFCICKICNCILRLCKIVQNLHLHFTVMQNLQLHNLKHHENVSFSCFGVYFFIHLNIAIVSISFFSFFTGLLRTKNNELRVTKKKNGVYSAMCGGSVVRAEMR